MKKRWFDAASKRVRGEQPPLERLAAEAPLTAADIEQLLFELRRRQAHPDLVHFFDVLGRMPVAVRLSRNLRVLLKLLATRDVKSTVRDGLDDDEHEALSAASELGLALNEKRTAQLLLDIESRHHLRATLSNEFMRARFNRDGYLA